jgi:16S rRNA processing protein RimM
MTGQRRVVLGKVGGLYGVRGWVKLWSFTDPVENLLDYRELELGRGGAGGRCGWRRGGGRAKALVARSTAARIATRPRCWSARSSP